MSKEFIKKRKKLEEIYPEFQLIRNSLEYCTLDDLIVSFQQNQSNNVSFFDFEKKMYDSNMKYEKTLDKLRFLYYLPVPYIAIDYSFQFPTTENKFKYIAGLKTNNIAYSLNFNYFTDTNFRDYGLSLNISIPLGDVFGLKFDTAEDRVSKPTNLIDQYFDSLIFNNDKLVFYTNLKSMTTLDIDYYECYTNQVYLLKQVLMLYFYLISTSIVFG